MRVPSAIPQPPRKILCVRSDRIGEFLLTLPALQFLKGCYPDTEISVLAQRQNLDMVQGLSFIDREIPMETLPDSLWGLTSAIRKERFDIAIIFNPKKKFHQACFLAGIPLRVGYDRKWGFLINRRGRDMKNSDQIHKVTQNIALTSTVCPGTFSSSLPPELPWNDREEIASFLKQEKLEDKNPFVVLHPFTSDPSKTLPFSFWARLIRNLTGRGENILIIGQAEEFARSEFSKLKAPGIFCAAGKLTLRQTGVLLKHCCRFYIGLDSGPYHMASLLGLPLTVIFRKPDMIALWGPYFGKENAKVILYREDQDEAAEQEVLRAFSDSVTTH